MKSAPHDAMGSWSSWRRFRTRVVLAIVVVTFLAATATWIQRDTVPPLWDSAVYLQESAILYHALTRQGVLAFLDAFSHSMGNKAPLIAALPLPLYPLLGESHAAARFVNLAWIVLAAIYIFRIGRKVAGGATGLLAVIVLNTFPLVAAMSRQYLVEYGLMAMVIVWIYYLLRWQSGEATRVPWILGVLLGFGLL
ncbi:MAG: glycosyltransferase family 39 protein, partial [Thermoanaerobaculia bacterium]